MDIYSPKGTKVKYIAENGWDSDVPYANKFLTKGEIYTVDWVDVGGSCSYVILKEFPENSFNTVMFEEVK